MSNPNYDNRYTKPADVDAKIATQAGVDAGQFAKITRSGVAPVSTSTGVFNQKQGLYNASAKQFRKTRAALAKSAIGSGVCRIGFFGDSTTQGVGISTSTTRMVQSYPGQTAALLNSAGYNLDGAYGLVQTFANPSGSWPEWVQTSGTWNILSNYCPLLIASASNAVLTFTSQNAGTIIDLWYLNTGASFTYKVDGGSSTGVTTDGSQTMSKVSITGLSNAVHSLVITSGSNTQIVAAYVHSSATSGLQFWNAGFGGARSTDLYGSNNWFSASKLLSAWQPHLTVIKVGINDSSSGSGVSASQYMTAMQSLITQALTTGDVLLATPDPANGVDTSSYTAALYSLADSNDLPLLDNSYRLQDYLTANSLGFYFDNYHPNVIGYHDEARSILSVLS